MLDKDVCEYALSCGYQKRNRAGIQRVTSMPARFVRLWGALEMDIQDLKQQSQAGNRYVFVMVDNANTLFTLVDNANTFFAHIPGTIEGDYGV